MEQSRKKRGSTNNQKTSRRKDSLFHQAVYNTADLYQCHPVSEFSAPLWSSQGQRLYPTVSDSAMCGYSLPYDYAGNPALPMYPLVFANMCQGSLEHVHGPTRIRKQNNKYLNTDAPGNNNTNFTSLPPINLDNIYSCEKRRFSDPGLNNLNESSSSGPASDSCSLENESLLEQLSELKADNKRLISELETTKEELRNLKTELAIINSKVTCHGALSLAQMVKEIRDAAEVREKLLLSKVESLINKTLESNNKTDNAIDFDSLKKRVSYVEHQLNYLRLHPKIFSKLNCEGIMEQVDVLNEEKHNSLDIMSKSHSGIDSSKEENSYTCFRLDVSTDNGESASDCNGNSLSTISYESISSSLGPGSMSTATLTVCGPVTDL